eukprot:799659_1
MAQTVTFTKEELTLKSCPNLREIIKENGYKTHARTKKQETLIDQIIAGQTARKNESRKRPMSSEEDTHTSDTTNTTEPPQKKQRVNENGPAPLMGNRNSSGPNTTTSKSDTIPINVEIVGDVEDKFVIHSVYGKEQKMKQILNKIT